MGSEKTVDAAAYEEFFAKFGGACRTKHVRHTRTDLRHRLWQLSCLLKGIALPPDKRPYFIPRTTALPKEFIRLDPWEMEYVFLMAKKARTGIVEVGRFNGGSAFLLSSANPNVPIYSIDIAPQNDELLKVLFREHSVGGNVQLIVGDSQKGQYPQIGAYDFLWIDGDHSYEGCMSDLTNWFPKLASGGHVLFHDSYFGSPVQDVIIDFIKSHDAIVVRSPYIPGRHWQHPMGSLAHLIKR